MSGLFGVTCKREVHDKQNDGILQESVRKAAQLKALRLQLQNDLEELQRWVET